MSRNSRVRSAKENYAFNILWHGLVGTLSHAAARRPLLLRIEALNGKSGTEESMTVFASADYVADAIEYCVIAKSRSPTETVSSSKVLLMILVARGMKSLATGLHANNAAADPK